MRAYRRAVMTVLGAAALLIAGYTATLAEGGVHRLAIQISDNNPQKMNTVLNVAANVVRHYSSKGEEAEVKIVAFNLGLHMLRSDTSPVQKRIKSFGESMPNVTFHACNNTIQGMTKKEGKRASDTACRRNCSRRRRHADGTQ